MIQSLKLFHSNQTHLRNKSNGEFFLLQTCQRSLYLGFNEDLLQEQLDSDAHEKVEVFQGEEAYQFLLETICGLKSRVLGENEIVSQFKKAYLDYLSTPNRNPHLMNIIEKLLSDGKKIRTRYLMEIGQQSYAGITRKILTQSNKDGEVLILGSGELAEDLIKLLKRRYTIVISARNQQRVEELCSFYKVSSTPWNENMQDYASSQVILNTIGAAKILFTDEFFSIWHSNHSDSRLFIDLGAPSVLDTSYKPEHGVIKLDHVFEHGQNLNQEKLEKVAKAHSAIDELTQKRKDSFSINFPFGWEELQFA